MKNLTLEAQKEEGAVSEAEESWDDTGSRCEWSDRRCRPKFARRKEEKGNQDVVGRDAGVRTAVGGRSCEYVYMDVADLVPGAASVSPEHKVEPHFF